MTDTDQKWLEVPDIVRKLYIKYADDAARLSRGFPNHPAGWVLNTKEIGPVLVKRADEDVNPLPSKVEWGWNAPLFPQLGEGYRNIQKYVGGPNPLTSMLLTGALMGGLGYGGGFLLNKLFPGAFSKQSPVGFGLTGALAGAAAPFFTHGIPNLQEYGAKGMLIPAELQGGPLYRESKKRLAEQAAAKRSEMTKTNSDFLGYVQNKLRDEGAKPNTEFLQKYALDDSAGSYLAEGWMDTDEWGRAIYRDPFLDIKEKALAAGVPAAAGAMRGSSLVTPRDVAGVAINAGLGYGYGYLGSLGAKFLGLTEPVQKGIQRAGLLAGAIRGITGMI